MTTCGAAKICDRAADPTDPTSCVGGCSATGCKMYCGSGPVSALPVLATTGSGAAPIVGTAAAADAPGAATGAITNEGLGASKAAGTTLAAAGIAPGPGVASEVLRSAAFMHSILALATATGKLSKALYLTFLMRSASSASLNGWLDTYCSLVP